LHYISGSVVSAALVEK